MGKINKVVFDTGPLVHLSEINLFVVLKLFNKIILSQEVLDEISKRKILTKDIKKIKNIKTITLSSESKNVSKILAGKYFIDLAEAESIALTIQERADVLITDDLDARHIAKNLGLEVHGSVGIILRAYREKIISKKAAIQKINELYKKSSLFITKDLVDWTVDKIRRYGA